jgi:hypothetical protein
MPVHLNIRLSIRRFGKESKTVKVQLHARRYFWFTLCGLITLLMVAANGDTGYAAGSATMPMQTTSPSDEPEPCAFVAPTPTNEHQLFLPNINSGTVAYHATRQASQLATPLQEIAQVGAPYAGKLAPGCVVTGPGGVKVAAVEGAITQTIAITVEIVPAPAEALPNNATAIGDFLRLSSNKDSTVPVETPFVVALPVPNNVDTSHLVLVHLSPATHLLDAELTGNFWGYLPGVYDATHNLFLVRLPFLLAEGTVVALIEHPDFESPPNQPDANVQAAAGAIRGDFSVNCMKTTFEDADDCTPVMQSVAKTMLDGIYQRMTDPDIFGFPRKLRLLDSGQSFIVSESYSVTALSASYAAFIINATHSLCIGVDAFYSPYSGFLALCLAPRSVVGEKEKSILIHEFFHAIQFTYPKVWEDFDTLKLDQFWVAEGMAAAAQGSYAETTMKRTDFYGMDNLQKVDQVLTTGVRGDGIHSEYWAQDFWVYIGATQGQHLGYLGTLLSIGGIQTSGIDDALKTLFNKSLSEFYWGWVKNQAIENAYDVGAPVSLCILSEGALTDGNPVDFSADMVFYPGGYLTYDRLPPLTAKVIEIDFGTRTQARVFLQHEGCAEIEDDAARASCEVAARQKLKSKIYVEHEEQCTEEALPGVDHADYRHLTNLSPDERYFVVVANVDTTNLDAGTERGYYIVIE